MADIRLVTAADCVETAQSKRAAECSRTGWTHAGCLAYLSTLGRTAYTGQESALTVHRDAGLPRCKDACVSAMQLQLHSETRRCAKGSARACRDDKPAHVLGAKRRAVIGAEPGLMLVNYTHFPLLRTNVPTHKRSGWV